VIINYIVELTLSFLRRDVPFVVLLVVRLSRQFACCYLFFRSLRLQKTERGLVRQKPSAPSSRFTSNGSIFLPDRLPRASYLRESSFPSPRSAWGGLGVSRSSYSPPVPIRESMMMLWGIDFGSFFLYSTPYGFAPPRRGPSSGVALDIAGS